MTENPKEDELENLLDNESGSEFGEPYVRDVFDHGARESVGGNIASWSAADFASIHTRFRPHLERHAKRYLRNPVQAEEVVQEAFLYLMTTLPEIDSELGVLKFLKWKVRLLSLDLLRSSTMNREVLYDSVEQAGEVDVVGLELERAEDNAIIQLALAKLSPRQREAIVATVYEEKSHEETAASMGLTNNGFRQLLYRARQSFRFALIGEAETKGRSASEIMSLAAKKAAQAARENASRVGVVLVAVALVTGLANSDILGSNTPDVSALTEESGTIPAPAQVITPAEAESMIASQPAVEEGISAAAEDEAQRVVEEAVTNAQVGGELPSEAISEPDDTKLVGNLDAQEFETVLATNVDQAGIYSESYAKRFSELFIGQSIEIFGGTGISAFVDLQRDRLEIGETIFQVNVAGKSYVAVPREVQREQIPSESGSTLVLVARDFYLVSDDEIVISDSPLADAKASVTLELDSQGSPSFASLVVDG